MKIILASSSPRRRDLLSSLGIKFDVISSDIDESILDGETPEVYVKRISEAKLQNVLTKINGDDDYLVISADTIVVLASEILGKPKDEADAINMLQKISGRTHEVITCFSVVTSLPNTTIVSITVRTLVEIKKLSEKEIISYVKTKEPLDKAGSYAIQGKAAYMIKGINGSYTNVVGLPLNELFEVIHDKFAIDC